MPGIQKTISSPSLHLFGEQTLHVTYGYKDPDYLSHNGVDCVPRLFATEGAVLAAADGVVEYVKDTVTATLPASDVNHADAFGNNIKIRHSDKLVTRYCHLAHGSVLVKPGQSVKKGDVIAKMGNTGCSTAHHLHFEVYQSGKRTDPLPFIEGSKVLLAENAPETALPPPCSDPETDLYTVGCNALNRRKSPGLSAEKSPQPLMNGDHVEVYPGTEREADGYVWVKARFVGADWWVAKKYLVRV